MGLEGYARGVLERGGIGPYLYRWDYLSSYRINQITFLKKNHRDRAYIILRKSGDFNPYKVGKLILRFDVVPQFGGKMRPLQR